MPWQESSAMSLRLAFVQQASAPDANLSALCAQFGISRPTGYKWLARFQEEGVAGLTERSRRPRQSPAHTALPVEQRIVELRRQHPVWGGRKLRARLQTLDPQIPWPSASTMTAVVQRHGLQAEGSAAPSADRPVQRFTHPAPNDLWQMDFKGHLPVASRSGRCHPLTVLDDHSRFALSLLACPNEQHATVHAALTILFRTYGLPRRLLCDNGAPWGSAGGPTPWTRLSVWLARLGISVRHGRPRHPQTQGKEERFHRTLRAEALAQSPQPLRDLAHAQAVFDTWRHSYNHERPHEALGLTVPARHYAPSPRPFPETLPPLEYDASWPVRKVQQEGWISWLGHPYHVGKAFVGQPVGLCPSQEEGLLTVYFAAHAIASLDIRSQCGYPLSSSSLHRSVVNHVPAHL